MLLTPLSIWLPWCVKQFPWNWMADLCVFSTVLIAYQFIWYFIYYVPASLPTFIMVACILRAHTHTHIVFFHLFIYYLLPSIPYTFYDSRDKKTIMLRGKKKPAVMENERTGWFYECFQSRHHHHHRTNIHGEFFVFLPSVGHVYYLYHSISFICLLLFALYLFINVDFCALICWFADPLIPVELSGFYFAPIYIGLLSLIKFIAFESCTMMMVMSHYITYHQGNRKSNQINSYTHTETNTFCLLISHSLHYKLWLRVMCALLKILPFSELWYVYLCAMHSYRANVVYILLD